MENSSSSQKTFPESSLKIACHVCHWREESHTRIEKFPANLTLGIRGSYVSLSSGILQLNIGTTLSPFVPHIFNQQRPTDSQHLCYISLWFLFLPCSLYWPHHRPLFLGFGNLTHEQIAIIRSQNPPGLKNLSMSTASVRKATHAPCQIGLTLCKKASNTPTKI